MTPAELIADLSRPGAFDALPQAAAPDAAGTGVPARPVVPPSVDIRQTHISLVFLAGPLAVKLKKPVDLGFLDFRSPAARRHFCLAEVRLNRRLAPDVYLGIAPVVRGPDGRAVMGALQPVDQPPDGAPASGQPPRNTVANQDDTAPGSDPVGRAIVDWAVVMRRLPAGASLAERLADGPAISDEWWGRLGARLAAFHAGARRGPDVSASGSVAVVAGNARENFAQTRAHVGITVSGRLHAALAARTEEVLAELGPLIGRRAAAGVPCDGHGDLRTDHVYLSEGRPAPLDIEVIDCVEFAERFRHADPVADVAFLDMDLRRVGRAREAELLEDAYFAAAGDAEGRALLPFYSAYRALVRAKVEGITASEPEVPRAQRQASVEAARRYWLQAAAGLLRPAERPVLVCTAGLPGTGKSTLACALAGRAGLTWIRSDEVRKRIAGLDPGQPVPEGRRDDLYSAEHTARTYEACRREAADVLADGGRVIVDANFRRAGLRRPFTVTARSSGVPVVWLECRIPAAGARERLARRTGDVSDADAATYDVLAAEWEPVATDEGIVVVLDTGATAEAVADAAVAALRRALVL